MKDEKKLLFKVGELASLVGISVRTLQHYDQKNLLNSKYNESHKRVYNRDDLLKLQQILFLKSLGFSLKEIDDIISKQANGDDLEKVFTAQRKILLNQIQNLNKIVETLNMAIAETNVGQKISMDRIVTILKLMNQENPYTFIVQYFDDEQLRTINNSLLKNPEIQCEENELFSQLDSLYHQGEDPAGIRGQELAKRWWDLVYEFTSGDKEMMKTLFSIGIDSSKWPENTKDIQKSIESFLAKALNIYLQNNNILIKDE
ncbi:MerR family transcriptional regulator [Clostridium boliviensis]|uniref:MerR family transcriptional regulator n=1 Tax=Clostridium boliviensis TaxID=318465 RepID=A0ABU4GQN1_9CLOT|nr:MerR family transcriptional regulator [Clostridium boliviensis]MDW2799921.1 MerR family transcriptional regulator [Clostridium boliviensis]